MFIIDGVLSPSLCMCTDKNMLSVWDQEIPPKYTHGTIHMIGWLQQGVKTDACVYVFEPRNKHI